MLHRIVYVSKAVGGTGQTLTSVAQILGVSGARNRRDEITSCVLFHPTAILQVAEGRRVDLDRLMRRVCADPRHVDIRILSDRPIATRRFHAPMGLCQIDDETLERLRDGRALDTLSPDETVDLLCGTDHSRSVA